MVELGYALSSEEHPPNDLVDQARAAEKAGFTFALISDHFHPWIDRQGHSPFVWSVIGGIARETERLRLGTGVTCPMIRIHPAIVAQAAATSASMMQGRFFLGVGTGENLNEHILGDHWPAPDERLELLEESIEVMRTLWEGGKQTIRGKHYVVEGARIYTLPDEPPEIAVAGANTRAVELAGRVGDAFVSTSADRELIETFEGAGGRWKPRYGQITVCWAESRDDAVQTAFEWWPNAAFKGQLGQELPLPSHFEQLVEDREADDIDGTIPLGPDADEYLEQIGEYDKAGYTHVCVHQIGSDQKGFLEFAKRELVPEL